VVYLSSTGYLCSKLAAICRQATGALFVCRQAASLPNPLLRSSCGNHGEVPAQPVDATPTEPRDRAGRSGSPQPDTPPLSFLKDLGGGVPQVAAAPPAERKEGAAQSGSSQPVKPPLSFLVDVEGGATQKPPAVPQNPQDVAKSEGLPRDSPPLGCLEDLTGGGGLSADKPEAKPRGGAAVSEILQPTNPTLGFLGGLGGGAASPPPEEPRDTAGKSDGPRQKVPTLSFLGDLGGRGAQPSSTNPNPPTEPPKSEAAETVAHQGSPLSFPADLAGEATKPSAGEGGESLGEGAGVPLSFLEDLGAGVTGAPLAEAREGKAAEVESPSPDFAALLGVSPEVLEAKSPEKPQKGSG